MRPTLALRAFRQTPRMLRPVPKEDQAGHTVTQRLRKLRSIPPELYPLGVVVGFAVIAAVYSSSRHFMTDKTIRFSRQGPAKTPKVSGEDSEEHH